MVFELLSDLQTLGMFISCILSNLFMPIILYEAWKSNKYHRPFRFTGIDYFVYPAFLMSVSSVLITFIFLIIPTLIKRIFY